MEQAYKEREREREIEGERERGEGEREGEVIVGDYSNLFLTSARSLGCVADCSLKSESCDESQLLTLSTSSYGVLVVHYCLEKIKYTVRIGCAPWGKLEICLCPDKSYNSFLIVLQ